MGCPYTSNPSKPQVSDTLSISPVSVTGPVTATGAFYDYSQNTSMPFTFVAPASYGGTFTDYAHDTIGFAVTFSSGPVTFNYQLDTLTSTAVANPSFNSGQISF